MKQGRHRLCQKQKDPGLHPWEETKGVERETEQLPRNEHAPKVEIQVLEVITIIGH